MYDTSMFLAKRDANYNGSFLWRNKNKWSIYYCDWSVRLVHDTTYNRNISRAILYRNKTYFGVVNVIMYYSSKSDVTCYDKVIVL